MNFFNRNLDSATQEKPDITNLQTAMTVSCHKIFKAIFLCGYVTYLKFFIYVSVFSTSFYFEL